MSAPTKRRHGYLVFRKVLFGLSYKQTLCGIEVAMLLPNKEDKARVFARITDALHLIARFAPHRFARLRHQVKRIWVFGTPSYQASWESDLETCVLDRNYVRSTGLTVEELAATIVHEATHARIHFTGIAYREDLRERIEQLCLKSEIWFARRLPNGEAVAERAESCLKIPTTYWNSDAFQDRNLEALQELGKGNWLIRVLAKSAGRRLAKRRARTKSDASPSESAPKTEK